MQSVLSENCVLQLFCFYLISCRPIDDSGTGVTRQPMVGGGVHYKPWCVTPALVMAMVVMVMAMVESIGSLSECSGSKRLRSYFETNSPPKMRGMAQKDNEMA